MIIALFVITAMCSGYAQAFKVACVGDSITEGANIQDSNKTYPAQLESMLRKFDSSWQTRNFGVGSATLLQQGDKPYMKQTAYQQALSWNPDVVVIMLGTNDSKPDNWVFSDDFVIDYCALINSFADLPSRPRIWICKPVPAFNAAFGIRNEVIRDEIIPLIEQIAALRDVGVIDLYHPLLDASDLFPDGIHPNAEGAGLMAEAIVPMLLDVRAEPDFNRDGYVNFLDYLLLVRHFSPNNTEPNQTDLYDLSPAPEGDGIVDLCDVAALFRYWLRTPGLLAHWKLDETKGLQAADEFGGHLGNIIGEAVWQPEAGHLGGALELNGVDSYVRTDFVLSPVDGPFTVFAWFKGGQPGQTLISQASDRDWLIIDSVTGGLRTGLTDGGRFTKDLISSVPIPVDDQWHQVTLIWDGSLRHLYFDNVQVAVDPAPLHPLRDFQTGLYFGASQNLAPDSFWSGLIDDIRIYDKDLLPMN